MESMKELILRQAETIDGKKRLSCAKAFAIAKQLGVPVKEVGAACEEEKIRISSCQLGCF